MARKRKRKLGGLFGLGREPGTPQYVIYHSSMYRVGYYAGGRNWKEPDVRKAKRFDSEADAKRFIASLGTDAPIHICQMPRWVR